MHLGGVGAEDLSRGPPEEAVGLHPLVLGPTSEDPGVTLLPVEREDDVVGRVEERSEAELLNDLRSAMDPAFLPRPLRKVCSLPRNETGKLPRAALLAALHGPT